MRKAQLIVVGLLSASAAIAAGTRQDISLNDGWRFIREDAGGAEAAAFPDASWQTVSLPHTWNNQDGQDGGNNYYRGPAWYRRHLSVDAQYAGKSLFLKFDAAATVADVFVNGRPAGSHKGNFAAFCLDVSSLLKTGEDNVIAVKVNNAHRDDTPPLSGDFTLFGGLYRGVHLLVLDKLSISPLDSASPGVYIRQVNVTPQSAELEITTKLRNAGEAEAAASVRCTIADREGKAVQTVSSDRKIAAGATADVVQSVTLAAPHLWNGRADPYLYRVTVDVGDGDSVTQPLGVRFFRVDPNEGFLLNGKPYPLYGVNRHQDRLDKGWAIGPAEHDEDLALILEMGCTGIRLAHYQHDQYFYDLCDRSGLVVWAENCMVDTIGKSQAFHETTRQQLTELVKQSYNHPSICFWGLYNEISPRKDDPSDAAFVEELNKLAKTLDPTRLTTAASDLKASNPVNWIPDTTAFNKYHGWYSGLPGDWAAKLDEYRRDYPSRCVGISEYGAGASVRQHEADVKQPKPRGDWHPEEWQSIVHEQAWKAMEERRWLWGIFLWNMFDFAADARTEGDQPGRNDKGMVTYDRKIKKDAFFWYKANWSSDPFVHITSRRFTPRPAGPAEVKIYSNLQGVELTVNGKSLGRKTGENHIFSWKDVALQPGENSIQAAGSLDGRSYSDACTWTCSGAAGQ